MDVARALKLRAWVGRMMLRLGLPGDWFLIPLAAVIGALAGLAAQGYGQLVMLSERSFGHLLKQGAAGGAGGARASGGWALLAILFLPALGGLIVGAIKAVFRLPAVSHGVPEVIESLARRGGRLPLRAGIFTALNSALTIGSGGSVGQEGPIIHIGSVVASVTGRFLRVSREHMATLVGCGAAAGLAAIFNAPIAGVLFVLEVLLRDFSFRTFMPVVIASVFGVTVNHRFEHNYGALFPMSPGHYVFTLPEVLPYLLLGLVCGAAAAAYGRTLYGLEHLWQKLRAPRWLKPALGGLALGALGVALLLIYPRAVPGYRLPGFFGNGYPVVIALLDPKSYAAGGAAGPAGGAAIALGFALLVLVGKIIGTGMTLGSGGSGGLFAPSLFIGAAAGSVYGLVLVGAGLMPGASPASYALAGMAGVLGGAVHCPLTALILVFEITRDYDVILPVMLVTITATLAARLMTPQSVYTMALREMGVRVGQFSDLTLLRRLTVADVPLAPAAVVHPTDPATRLLELAGRDTATDYVVCDPGGRYLGMVLSQDLRHALVAQQALPLMVVADLMRVDVRSVAPQDTLEMAMAEFARQEVSSLAVLEGGAVRRVVTRAGLIRRYQQLLGEEH
jgi:CIC family chloride channel protein